MSNELIERIDDSVGVITDTKQIDKLLVDCKLEIERLNTECDRYSVAVNNCNGGSLCSCAINFNTQGNDL